MSPWVRRSSSALMTRSSKSSMLRCASQAAYSRYKRASSCVSSKSCFWTRCRLNRLRSDPRCSSGTCSRPRTTFWYCSSATPNPLRRPAASACSRRSERQSAWIVPRVITSARSRSVCFSRTAISSAARFVNVTAQMRSGATPRVSTSWLIRAMRQKVLPAPGPAITSTGPGGASMASRCRGRGSKAMQGIYEHSAPDQSSGPARRDVRRETARSLVDRDAQPQLADVRVATRVGQRVPVPVRRETDAAPDRNVVPEAEQRRPTGLAGAPEATDPGAYRAEAQTTGQEKAAGRGRVETNRRGHSGDRERRAAFRLGPTVGRNAEQEFLAQGPAERDVAAHGASTATAVLTTE